LSSSFNIVSVDSAACFNIVSSSFN
jgi:hypothetical protein